VSSDKINSSNKLVSIELSPACKAVIAKNILSAFVPKDDVTRSNLFVSDEFKSNLVEVANSDSGSSRDESFFILELSENTDPRLKISFNLIENNSNDALPPVEQEMSMDSNIFEVTKFIQDLNFTESDHLPEFATAAGIIEPEDLVKFAIQNGIEGSRKLARFAKGITLEDFSLSKFALAAKMKDAKELGIFAKEAGLRGVEKLGEFARAAEIEGVEKLGQFATAAEIKGSEKLGEFAKSIRVKNLDELVKFAKSVGVESDENFGKFAKGAGIAGAEDFGQFATVANIIGDEKYINFARGTGMTSTQLAEFATKCVELKEPEALAKFAKVTKIKSCEKLAEFANGADLDDGQLAAFAISCDTMDSAELAKFARLCAVSSCQRLAEFATNCNITDATKLAEFANGAWIVDKDKLAEFARAAGIKDNKHLADFAIASGIKDSVDLAKFAKGAGIEGAKNLAEFATRCETKTPINLAQFVLVTRTLSLNDLIEFATICEIKDPADLGKFARRCLVVLPESFGIFAAATKIKDSAALVEFARAASIRDNQALGEFVIAAGIENTEDLVKFAMAAKVKGSVALGEFAQAAKIKDAKKLAAFARVAKIQGAKNLAEFALAAGIRHPGALGEFTVIARIKNIEALVEFTTAASVIELKGLKSFANGALLDIEDTATFHALIRLKNREKQNKIVNNHVAVNEVDDGKALEKNQKDINNISGNLAESSADLSEFQKNDGKNQLNSKSLIAGSGDGDDRVEIEYKVPARPSKNSSFDFSRYGKPQESRGSDIHAINSKYFENLTNQLNGNKKNNLQQAEEQNKPGNFEPINFNRGISDEDKSVLAEYEISTNSNANPLESNGLNGEAIRLKGSRNSTIVPSGAARSKYVQEEIYIEDGYEFKGGTFVDQNNASNLASNRNTEKFNKNKVPTGLESTIFEAKTSVEEQGTYPEEINLQDTGSLINNGSKQEDVDYNTSNVHTLWKRDNRI